MDVLAAKARGGDWQLDATAEADVYSRFFAPWAGIPEDPVTGSANAVLGKYFCEALGVKELRAIQCSQRRGELHVSLQGDGVDQRVLVRGHCVTTIRGEMLVP